MHSLARTLIVEGVGDIVFDVQASTSFDFTWKSYGQHKVQSLKVSLLVEEIADTHFMKYFQGWLRKGSCSELVSAVHSHQSYCETTPILLQNLTARFLKLARDE
jgi:hypothetical protein